MPVRRTGSCPSCRARRSVAGLDPSYADLCEELAQDDPRIETVPCHLAGPLAVPFGVRLELRNRCRRVIDVADREQTLSRREMVPEPGVLLHDGCAGSEVSSAPVAEPATAGRDVSLLAHTELC